MIRPEIIGWAISTNENNIKMATLPVSKMVEILKYLEYSENELNLKETK